MRGVDAAGGDVPGDDTPPAVPVDVFSAVLVVSPLRWRAWRLRVLDMIVPTEPIVGERALPAESSEGV